MEIIKIGVNDHNIKLFEGQYNVSNGMSYNSYLIKDEKIAIFDTVDKNFTDEWLENIVNVLGERIPDFLVILHMEPDHSASIEAFKNKYKDTVIVSNAKSFQIMKQFFPNIKLDNVLEVKDGEELNLGVANIHFIFAPMVHWPEVMVAYESKTKSLFSADAFGKFGSLDCNEPWLDEARRYYIGIVGKYGLPVQNLFKKLATYQIEAIYPLHGPELKDNLSYYLNYYQKWASYTPEEDGVCIVYASVYGHTKKAALELKNNLDLLGIKNEIFDLTTCDISNAIAKSFMYSKLVIASITYNGDVFPCMHQFLYGIKERGFNSRTIAIIENGSWAPMAKKVIMNELNGLKNISYCNNLITIKSNVTEEIEKQLMTLAQELK